MTVYNVSTLAYIVLTFDRHYVLCNKDIVVVLHSYTSSSDSRSIAGGVHIFPLRYSIYPTFSPIF